MPFNSLFTRLLVASVLITLASCSNKAAPKTPPELSSVREEPAEQLKRIANEFETSINTSNDRAERKQILQKYGNIFYAFAKAHSDTEAGIQGWCYVMGLGNEQAKKEALKTVLDSAEKDLSSTNSVELLGEVYRNGDENYKTVALAHLEEIASQEPTSDNGMESLQLLSTMKEFPETTRNLALKRWVDKFLKSDETSNVIDRLSEHQCMFNEKWLKKIAACSEGELRAKTIVKLATYLNRRDSVRDFYRDAPASRFERLPEYFERYLNAPKDPDELQQMIELLKSVKSADENVMATAKRELFAIEYLTAGKAAPEIEGADFDGVEFRLSDYRGKVVLLDFWSDG